MRQLNAWASSTSPDVQKTPRVHLKKLASTSSIMESQIDNVLVLITSGRGTTGHWVDLRRDGALSICDSIMLLVEASFFRCTLGVFCASGEVLLAQALSCRVENEPYSDANAKCPAPQTNDKAPNKQVPGPLSRICSDRHATEPTSHAPWSRRTMPVAGNGLISTE